MLTFLKKIFVWWDQETLGTKNNLGNRIDSLEICRGIIFIDENSNVTTKCHLLHCAF